MIRALPAVAPIPRARLPQNHGADGGEMGHCVTRARRLPCSLTGGQPGHDQRSQGVSALVRGAIEGPPARIHVRGPRAEPHRPPLPSLIHHARRTLRPRHATPARALSLRPRFAHDQIVGLRVAFADVALRDRVKQAGGIWNPERRVWQLRYRPRGRARPERPHRRRTRIQQWMPGVEWRESPCRCPGDIQVEMLASTVGCRHPVANDGVAVEY